MIRNYLKGTIGDEINVLLAAAAFNFKKKLNQIRMDKSKRNWMHLTKENAN